MSGKLPPSARSSGSSGSISTSFFGLKAELERSKNSSSPSSSSKRNTHPSQHDVEHRKSKKKLAASFLESTSTKDKRQSVKASPLSSGKGKHKARATSEWSTTPSAQLDSIRQNLERKARIYQQLQDGKFAGISKEQLKEGSIDWERKLAEPQFHHSPPLEDEEQASRSGGAGDVGGEDDPEIEYMDEFGRTRMSRLSEIPRELVPAKYGGDKQEDDDLEEDNAIYGPATSFPVYDATLHRQAMAAKAGAVQRFNADFENRHRGAAFYRFSASETERQSQMQQLAQLRQETIANRQARHKHANTQGDN